jgi:hypothetical protein
MHRRPGNHRLRHEGCVGCRARAVQSNQDYDTDEYHDPDQQYQSQCQMLSFESGNSARQPEWTEFCLGGWLAPTSRFSAIATPPSAYRDTTCRKPSEQSCSTGKWHNENWHNVDMFIFLTYFISLSSLSSSFVSHFSVLPILTKGYSPFELSTSLLSYILSALDHKMGAGPQDRECDIVDNDDLRLSTTRSVEMIPRDAFAIRRRSTRSGRPSFLSEDVGGGDLASLRRSATAISGYRESQQESLDRVNTLLSIRQPKPVKPNTMYCHSKCRYLPAPN